MNTINLSKALPLVTSVLILCSSTTVEASLITQSDFSNQATLLDLSRINNDTTTVNTNDLSLSGGIIQNYTIGWPDPQLNYLHTSDNPGTVTIQFNSLQSAVGFGFLTDNSPITLSLYNKSNTLIDQYQLQNTGLATAEVSGNPYPVGFLGLNEGISVIDHAFITTGLTSNTFFIGPIIYQAQQFNLSAPASGISAVPLPSAFWFLISGLLAAIGLKRKS